MRDLAAEFPNISEAVKLPEQTRGYQRKAQTMLGYHERAYATGDRHRRVRPLRRQQPPVAGATPPPAPSAGRSS